MDQPLADIKEVLPPAGLYHGKLAFGGLADEKTDKRSRVYRRARVGVRLVAPDESMDGDAITEFESFGDEDILATWSKLVYGQNDTARVAGMLQRAGVPLVGTLKETLESIKGLGGIDVLANVQHETYEGETRAIVTSILPIDTD